MSNSRIIRDFPSFEAAQNRASGFEEFNVFDPALGRLLFDPQDGAGLLVDEEGRLDYSANAYPKVFDVTGRDRELVARVPRQVADRLNIAPVSRLAIRREVSYYRAENPEYDRLAFHVALSAVRRFRGPKPLAEFLQISPADYHRDLFGGAVRVVMHDKDGETFVPIGPEYISTMLFLRTFGAGKATPVKGIRERLIGSQAYRTLKRQATW